MNKENLNKEFLDFEVDYLYHLGIDTSINLAKTFENIKFVVFTPSNANAAVIAHMFFKIFYGITENNFLLEPLYKTERFHFYVVGNTIIVSAGIGMPSTLICLNEITKLCIHAEINNPIFFHISPSGGLGLPIGSLVINDKALNTKLAAEFCSIECGIEITYPSNFDQNLKNELLNFATKYTPYNTLIASSISAWDYYDEQLRLDGFLEPNYTIDERNGYLKQAKNLEVAAINMESLAFAGFCQQLQIKASAISAIVSDMFISDQVLIGDEEQKQIIRNAATLCANYLGSME